jgi:acetyl-CoA acetyltransferase
VSAIKAGQCDLALAVGFDKHPAGMFSVDPEEWGIGSWFGEVGLMVTTQFFAMKIKRYMHDHGISDDSLVRVAVKNFRNGSLSPNAWRRTPFDYETVASSEMLNDPLRKYMFCAPCEGGAAAVVCRGDLAGRYSRKPIWVKGLAVRTRKFGSLEVFQPANPVERAPTPVELASRAAFEQAGVDPRDVDVAQLQDTESGAEIMHMAETGLCEHGQQEKMVRDGETEIGGRLPVNTDGGLLANGEPVGASGLRQVWEICLQLRGEAGERQSPRHPKVGVCQVYGAPGLSSVTVLAR